jgi:hypothetical protein
MDNMKEGPHDALIAGMRDHARIVTETKADIKQKRRELEVLLTEQDDHAKRAYDIAQYLSKHPANGPKRAYVTEAGECMGGFTPKRRIADTVLIRIWMDPEAGFIARLGGDSDNSFLQGNGMTPGAALVSLTDSLSKWEGSPDFWAEEGTKQEELWLEFIKNHQIEESVRGILAINRKA